MPGDPLSRRGGQRVGVGRDDGEPLAAQPPPRLLERRGLPNLAGAHEYLEKARRLFEPAQELARHGPQVKLHDQSITGNPSEINKLIGIPTNLYFGV
jgi:hypothetical protein